MDFAGGLVLLRPTAGKRVRRVCHLPMPIERSPARKMVKRRRLAAKWRRQRTFCRRNSAHRWPRAVRSQLVDRAGRFIRPTFFCHPFVSKDCAELVKPERSRSHWLKNKENPIKESVQTNNTSRLNRTFCAFVKIQGNADYFPMKTKENFKKLGETQYDSVKPFCGFVKLEWCDVSNLSPSKASTTF